MKYLIPLLVAITLLCGCTQAQVERAKAAQAQAEEILAAAVEAREATTAALAEMKVLAVTIGGDKGAALVIKAEHALEVIEDKVAIAKRGVETTAKAVEIAETSHAAGGTTIDVLCDLLTYFVPGAGVALLAIRKAMATGKALKQTVRGLDVARKSMPLALWKEHVAPSLESAQDEQVKAAITLEQTKAKIEAAKMAIKVAA